MKPRRTPSSNQVWRLQGGTEDNDLWAETRMQDGTPVIKSVWELTPAERQAVAEGANIALLVWGGQPPVAIETTAEPLGRG